MKPFLTALFVFGYFVLLAVHTVTGLLYFGGSVRPWAVVKIDDVLDVLFVSRVGPETTALILVALGAVFAVIAYRRAANEKAAKRQQAETQSPATGA